MSSHLQKSSSIQPITSLPTFVICLRVHLQISGCEKRKDSLVTSQLNWSVENERNYKLLKFGGVTAAARKLRRICMGATNSHLSVCGSYLLSALRALPLPKVPSALRRLGRTIHYCGDSFGKRILSKYELNRLDAHSNVTFYLPAWMLRKITFPRRSSARFHYRRQWHIPCHPEPPLRTFLQRVKTGGAGSFW